MRILQVLELTQVSGGMDSDFSELDTTTLQVTPPTSCLAKTRDLCIIFGCTVVSIGVLVISYMVYSSFSSLSQFVSSGVNWLNSTITSSSIAINYKGLSIQFGG